MKSASLHSLPDQIQSNDWHSQCCSPSLEIVVTKAVAAPAPLVAARVRPLQSPQPLAHAAKIGLVLASHPVVVIAATLEIALAVRQSGSLAAAALLRLVDAQLDVRIATAPTVATAAQEVSVDAADVVAERVVNPPASVAFAQRFGL